MPISLSCFSVSLPTSSSPVSLSSVTLSKYREPWAHYSAMLILGGSATVTDLTGANTVAVCFLIPLGVSVYVLAGGMRASLIADYSHTVVLYAILLTFAFTVYATSDVLGSPSRVWQLLQEASAKNPVSGNAEGSYLTMRSKSGLIFGVLNIIGNFVSTAGVFGHRKGRGSSKRGPSSTIKHTGSEPSPVRLTPVSRLFYGVESHGSVFPWVSPLPWASEL